MLGIVCRTIVTHVIFKPLDFIAGMENLAPKPSMDLTGFHDMFAPNSKQHALVLRSA